MPVGVPEIRRRARKIKLLLMDVDGVLTDGRIYYVSDLVGRAGSASFVETKTFHSRDGLGIRLAHEAGLRTGILSGRSSPVVRYRAKELGIELVREGALEKLEPYRALMREARLREEEVCYIGDDLVDLPILKRAGLAVGVGDGHRLLRRYVHYWTRARGGLGAVRETIELILQSQGKLQAVLDRFLA